jgi:hypothetical protein
VAAASSIAFATRASIRTLHAMQGRSGIAFAAAARPRTVRTLRATSGIVFAARSVGISRVIHPQAISEIVFTTGADLVMSWADWTPCKTGGWQAIPCEPGIWQPIEACHAGAWTPMRLP